MRRGLKTTNNNLFVRNLFMIVSWLVCVQGYWKKWRRWCFVACWWLEGADEQRPSSPEEVNGRWFTLTTTWSGIDCDVDFLTQAPRFLCMFPLQAGSILLLLWMECVLLFIIGGSGVWFNIFLRQLLLLLLLLLQERSFRGARAVI